MNDETLHAADRGMQLAAHLPDIMPPQASAQIKPVYEDIQQVLRVPIVNRIFRTLANYPDYLEPAWQQMRPLASLRVFEQSADELRADAAQRILPALATLPAPTEHPPGDMEKLRAFNDTIHYVLPKLLLIVTALARTPDDPETDVPSSRQITDLSTIAPGVADGAVKVAMIEPDKADERIKALFEQVKQRHAHPLVSSYYRGLANWPDVLQAAWEAIGSHIGSGEYNACKAALIGSARAHVRNWPLISAETEPSKADEIRAILAAFQHRFIPEMLLDVILIKCLVDGKEAAGRSRFSVA